MTISPTASLRAFSALVVGLGLLLSVPGCAYLRSLTALSQVRFDLERVDGIRLAGVEIDHVRGAGDVGAQDLFRIGQAISQNRLPLDLTVHVGAENPSDNPTARILALDWTLHVRDRETVSGLLEREISVPAGGATRIPIGISLDLLRFFDGSARDLVNLAANLAGRDGDPVDIRLTLVPTVETPIGPIRYDRPLILEGSR